MFEFMNIVIHNHEEFVVFIQYRVVYLYHVTFVHVLSKCLAALNTGLNVKSTTTL